MPTFIRNRRDNRAPILLSELKKEGSQKSLTGTSKKAQGTFYKKNNINAKNARSKLKLDNTMGFFVCRPALFEVKKGIEIPLQQKRIGPALSTYG